MSACNIKSAPKPGGSWFECTQLYTVVRQVHAVVIAVAVVAALNPSFAVVIAIVAFNLYCTTCLFVGNCKNFQGGNRTNKNDQDNCVGNCNNHKPGENRRLTYQQNRKLSATLRGLISDVNDIA